MKTRLSSILVAIAICMVLLVPASALAETITVLNDDFESTTSYFTKRTTNFSSTYQTSEIKLQTSSNHVWQLAIGDGASTDYRCVECYTENYNSYIFPSNAVDITYEADVWIVNNNRMPDQVFIGMNFGYQNRIMRLRFSWDTKEILYQWTTGNHEVALTQSFVYGRWHSIKVIYHTASQTCDIYVDGIPQSLGYSTVEWTDSNVSVNGHNPLIKFNLLTKTTTLPLSLVKPIRANFDNVKVYYTQESAPMTGDNSRTGLWLAILLLSVTGTFVLVRFLQKKRVSEKNVR